MEQTPAEEAPKANQFAWVGKNSQKTKDLEPTSNRRKSSIKGGAGPDPHRFYKPSEEKEQRWMTKPETKPVAECPPGLEYLTSLDQLIVQETAQSEVRIGVSNVYQIHNNKGKQVFFARKSDGRPAAGSANVQNSMPSGSSMDLPVNGYIFHVMDNENKEVLRIKYRKGGASCFGGAGSGDVVILTPDGNVIGKVSPAGVSFFGKSFSVKDASGSAIGSMRIPRAVLSESDKEIIITTPDRKAELGRIIIGDNNSVSFPADKDVQMKSILLGAYFLINEM